jgi:two-component system phosphate regulon sensor histidine kinase PhoR
MLGEVGEKLRSVSIEPADDFVVSLPDLIEIERPLVDVITKYRDRITLLCTEKTRLEVTIESIAEGILVVGRDGRVVMANTALGRLFALNMPLEGRPTAEVVRQASIQDAICYSLEHGTSRSLEVEMMGSIARHLDMHVEPIRRGNECVGVVSVFYDITRLRQLERLRRDFVANVSHELRTPLTAIKGYAETLTDGALEDREAAGRFIAIISSHADRLNRLLDDLLDLSRLESDQLQVDKTPCNLRSLVEVGSASVAAASEKKNIAISSEVAADIEVSCDPKLIEQALINLLDNAIKYTAEGGEVRVFTRIESSRLWLDVVDTGIGIPSEDLGRVFERFYRVDKGRSRAMGGTGLGLAIVRHVVEAHGERVLGAEPIGRGHDF